MQITIVEDKSNRLVFEVDGATHTLCNMIRQSLWEDDDVKVAGYSISHPYVGKPRFILETKRDGQPRKTLSSAIKKLKKEIEDIGKKSAKELK